jgi:hypothetical protein
MELLRSWAYDYTLRGFPLVAIVGFVSYALIVTTALLTALKPLSQTLRRVPVKVHRRLACAATLAATAHLLMALSIHVSNGTERRNDERDASLYRSVDSRPT